MKAVFHRRSAAKLINDWYPEKVNQAFSSGKTAAGRFLPASEIGLPSTPPNHKSDGGSLQSWGRPSTQLPLEGEAGDGHRAKRQGLLVIATNFAGVRPWRGNRLRQDNGKGSSRAGSVRANKLVRVSGLWFNVPLMAMASRAIMEGSVSNRAIVAAGGLAVVLGHRPADAKLSGMRSSPDSRRRALPVRPRLAAAGRTRKYAQQDADRRLPPGGDARCRGSRQPY